MPSQILSNLYIGDFHDAREVDPSEFYRVTVAQELEGVGDEYFPLLDGPYAENVPHLDRAIARVADLLAEEKRVLVHCAAGISRSAAVVIGVLMARGMPFAYALWHLRDRHAVAAPHPGLLKHRISNKDRAAFEAYAAGWR